MAKQQIDPKDAKKIPPEATEPTAAPPVKEKQVRVVCPITKEEFLRAGKSLTIDIDGQKFTAMPKEFSTGSIGFHMNPKIVIMVGDKAVQCQVGLNITVIGSKPK